MLKLIIEDDEGRKTVVPFTRDEITIGRQEGNTIRLTERNVSRRHARLMRNNGHVLIEDLGSYNGIRINGDRISGQVQVADGDLIQIGDYDLALQKEEMAGATVPLDSAGPAPSAPTRKMPDVSLPTMPALPAIEDPDEGEVGKDAPPPIPKHQATSVIRLDSLEGANRKRAVENIDASEAPRLVILNTELAGREFKCTRTELKIGRVDDNDIVIDHRSLSRTHCKVVREENGEWRIIDMQSANGLMVNGESYAQVTLRPGDVIELGHVKIKFAAAGDEVDVPPASSGSSSDTLAPAAPSKVPLIAMAIAILVLLVDGGGWLLMKSNTDTGPKKDPTTKIPVPPQVDEIAAKRAAAMKAAFEKVEEAKAAAAKLDFVAAENALSEAKVNGEMLPEAKEVLSLLAAEKDKRTALELAGRFLDTNALDKAKLQLAQAEGTKLMADKYAELKERLDKAIAAKQPAPKNDPVPKPEPKNDPKPEPKNDPAPTNTAAPKNAEAEALVSEGTAEMKAGNLERAAIRVEKCIKVAASYAPCYKLGGSVYARISQRDQSLSDQAKAKKYYQRFVELASPDDPAVPKVKKLLEDAQ